MYKRQRLSSVIAATVAAISSGPASPRFAAVVATPPPIGFVSRSSSPGRAGASAMTDVTGFGLLGHLHEMARASGVRAEISAASVPPIAGVLELLRSDAPPIAGGTRRNRDWVEPFVEWAGDVPEPLKWLLCDAMTSGGLLIAVPAGAGAPGVRIGGVSEGRAGAVAVSA